MRLGNSGISQTWDLCARYYEPVSGRFLSADPLGQGVSPSLYDYCGGDPVNYFDPTGRCPDGTTGTGTVANNSNGIPTTDPGTYGQNLDDPQRAGSGQGSGVTSDSYPYFQQNPGTCWAASFRNFLHDSGVPDVLIPTEAQLVDDVLQTTPSPGWNFAKNQLTQVGILEQEVIDGLLPIANSLGVDATVSNIGTSADPNNTLGKLERRFDRTLDNSPAAMIVVPSGQNDLSAEEGAGHVVTVQSSPDQKTVTYIDPAVPAPVPDALPTKNVSDVWSEYSGWGYNGGGYVISVKRTK